MGVYSILLGKGILLPRKTLAKIVRERNNVNLINEDTNYGFAMEVKYALNNDWEVVSLGHDAFVSRNGDILEAFDQKHRTLSDDIIKNEDLESLVFIGYTKDLCLPNGEFSWYVNAPEIIYGLAALIPQILTDWPLLEKIDCSALHEYFGREPQMWTFVPDCCCCG